MTNYLAVKQQYAVLIGLRRGALNELLNVRETLEEHQLTVDPYEPSLLAAQQIADVADEAIEKFRAVLLNTLEVKNLDFLY